MQDNHIELQKSKKKIQEQNSEIQQLLDIKSAELDKKTNDQNNMIKEFKEVHIAKLKEEKEKLNDKLTMKDNKINELSQSYSDAK